MAGGQQAVFHLAAGLFPAHPRARPVVQIAAVGGSIRKDDAEVAARFTLQVFALKIVPCPGTAHDAKPRPSPSGIRLPTRPFRPRQEKPRSGNVRPREGSAAVCSGCTTQPGSGLRSSSRATALVSFLCGAFWFPASTVMRRVDCRNCGVVVEEVPWSDGKHR